MLQNCVSKKDFAILLIILLLSGLKSSAQLNPPLGSSNWKYVNPSPHGLNLNDMSFIDNATGLAVGSNGAIARTTDSGRNWVFIPYKFINAANTVALGSFNDVQFVTPSIAYAVGSAGLMIKSTDGGLNWTPVVNPLTKFNRNIGGLHFLNKDTVCVGVI